MRRKLSISLLACGLAVFAQSNGNQNGQGQNQNQNGQGNNQDQDPDGKGIGTVLGKPNNEGHTTSGSRITGHGINYHGGPVMTVAPTHVYYIWYGWGGAYDDTAAGPLLQNLIGGLSGSPWFNINTSYYNGSGVHVQNSVTLTKSVGDNYSQGTNVSDAGIQAIVSNAINHLGLPADANGVYFVLTSADVNETSGFCTQYCGWHTHGTINGTDIKYAFVGNAARCPNACAWNTASSPNNDIGADAMASIIGHELSESVTDPDLNAWFDNSGEENADKCAWTFGTTQTLANGSVYNVTLGGVNYLIQRNWVNAVSPTGQNGYCSMSY